MKRAARVLMMVCIDGRASRARARLSQRRASAEAFAQLKSLVGHWEEQKGSENKSMLDVEAHRRRHHDRGKNSA